MGKARKRKIVARLRVQKANNDASRLRDDPVMQELFAPLLAAIGPGHEERFWATIESEASGVLAWGVRTGYLLWVRTHPKEVPTREQVREWIRLGQANRSQQQPLREVVIAEAKSYGDEPDQERGFMIEHALQCAIEHVLYLEPGHYTIDPWESTGYQLSYVDVAGTDDQVIIWFSETTPFAGSTYTHCFRFSFDMEVDCAVYRSQEGTYQAQTFSLKTSEPDLEVTRKVVNVFLEGDGTLVGYSDPEIKNIIVEPFLDREYGYSWHVAFDYGESPQHIVDVFVDGINDDKEPIYCMEPHE